MCSGLSQPVAAAAASGRHQCISERLHSHFFLSHGVKSICQKPFTRPAHPLGSSGCFFPLTREDRPNEAIAAPLQRFTLPCYYCQVLSAQAKIGMIKNSCFFFSPLNRTLLALGCRVVHVNPNADSSLKKIKLPKKQVMNAYVDCYCL